MSTLAGKLPVRADHPGGGASTPFLSHIHSFRAVAIVAVVGTHLLDEFPVQGTTGRVVESVVQNASVPFIFIAGFLFQHLSANFAYGGYLLKKLRYVIVPYLFVSLPYIVYRYARGSGIYAPEQPRVAQSDVLHGASALLTGAHMPVPLWFIPTMVVLYLLAPCFIAVDRRPRSYWVLPLLMGGAMLVHRPHDLTKVGHSVLYFGPVYLFGMWSSRYRVPIARAMERWLPGAAVLWVALTLVELVWLGQAGAVFSRRPFTMEAGVIDTNLLLKLVGSLALVEVLRRCDALVRGRLSYLADASFGLFFVHGHVIRLTAKAARWLAINPGAGVVSFAVTTAVVCTASLVVVAVVRRVTGAWSRYLIGC
jgi:fucose 4-O-acetylase-like acetyltransferase